MGIFCDEFATQGNYDQSIMEELIEQGVFMRTAATTDQDFLEADEEEWQEITQATSPNLAPQRPGWRRTLPGFGVVALIAALATVVGLRLWRQAETGIARIEAGARTVVQLETLRANAKQPLYSDVTTVESVEINASGLLVRVLVTGTYGACAPQPVVETRFYRACASGWCRSAPLVSFWGKEATLDTDNLHFVFYERDRRAVESAAAPVDAYISTLRDFLGLPPLAPSARITVTVAPTWVKPGAVAADGAMQMPSPQLLRIPTESDATALLRDLLQAQVLFHTLEEATARFHVREEWRVLVLYLRWWIEQNPSKLLDVQAGEATDGREGYALCTPYTLALLSVDTFADYIPGFSEARPRIANVFFDFLVSGKTQGSVPRLLAALGRHETWNSLAPEVFGMSFEELQRTLNCDASIDRSGFANLAR